MFLAAIALTMALTFGGSTPAPANFSQLPATQPGLSRDEGVFFVSDADDGSRAVYFIAGNTRHSIVWTDMQIELQLNPLWPVFTATRDQVLDFAEGAPIGAAKTGLVGGTPAPAPAPAPPPAQPSPAPAQPSPAAAQPNPAPAQPSPPPAQPNPTPVQSNPPAAQPSPAPAQPAQAAAGDDSQPNPPAAQPSPPPAQPNPPAAQPSPAPAQPNPAPAQPAQAAATDDSQPTTYTLKPDDNLTRIAAQFGSSVDAILAANGLPNPNRIYAGQTLVIPTPDSAIAEDTPTDSAAAPEGTTYTVQRGDSAIKIARNFGIPEAALLEANGIANPNRVYVGQVLTIPDSSS